ncbi:MAG: double-strand break repair protein AddB [Proteobacteria bacterium]|nr:double-strand break repair protein AddB [Pseudomonadota bacterium]
MPFVDALAAGVLAWPEAGRPDGGGDVAAAVATAADLPDPLALARVTILLPTRRACRSLAEAFGRLGASRPLLLPLMMPLGDLDEDEIELSAAMEASPDAGAELPPAIPGLRRQLMLSRLILARGSKAWDEPPTADQAVRLAAELAKLLDQVQTERLGFEGLAGLVPEELARHWQETLEFLSILTENWPKILAGEGCLDGAQRRNRVIEAQAEAWRRSPPAGPVIAAGSTGSIPATADLLKVVANLEKGCVILPGLDTGMPDEAWRSLAQSHPQYGLARLLDHIGVGRDAVGDWQAPGIARTVPARAALINRALRPAGGFEDRIMADDDALEGVVRLDCPSPQEEAGAIALMMRQALEEADETAALVTPDRDLARRVAAELKRWGVEVDDSAGVPLAATPVGAFLRLLAAMAANDAAPHSLLQALKHPMATGGMGAGVFRAKVRELERTVLRGPRPAPGFGGLLAALAASAAGSGDAGGPGRGRRRRQSRSGDLIRWLKGIADGAEPLMRALAEPAVSFQEVLKHHVGFAETLATSDEKSGAERLWAGEDGEAMANFVAELDDALGDFPPAGGWHYPALLDALLVGRVVRPRYGQHARLHIWGPLEARLQHADLVILGGMNEGTWPPEAEPDPWLSRPMREAFGLPLPERRIGLSAHDFVQAFSAPRVAMTRATRVEGTPTVPSRWLLRLDNLLEAEGTRPRLRQGIEWLAWQQSLDRPEAFDSPSRPDPRPPVAARPRSLSVTEVETWIRNPYAIYARHVLGLRPLDAIDADPGAAERGTFIHRSLDRFVRQWPASLPEDARERLIDIGREVFAEALGRPGVWAFWWPRFERIAGWFVDFERARRARRPAGARLLLSEGRGQIILGGPAGPFVLSARADRIDRLEDYPLEGDERADALAIIDYKTGGLPAKGDISKGFSPQLGLEAAIASQGGFEGVPALPVAELSYWRLSGGDPPGSEQTIKDDPVEIAAAALAGLERLIVAFDDASTPYLAHPRPAKAPRFDDYGHLARVKEWSNAAGDGGGAAS